MRNKSEISIKELIHKTGMKEEDIVYILEHQKILRKDNSNNQYFNCEQEFLENILKLSGRPGRTIHMEKIRWKPIITTTELAKDH